MSKTPLADELKKKYATMNKMREDAIQMIINPPMVVSSCGSLASSYPTTSLVCTTQSDKVNNNKEQSMYLSINTTGNLDAQQKNYFGQRAVEIFFEKKEALKKDFGLIDDEAPRTAKELAARIAAGKFVIDTTKEVSEWDFSIRRAFSWRDPSVKKDEDGYKAARKVLDKKLTETKDIIVASEKATDALAAVKDLETATFH